MTTIVHPLRLGSRIVSLRGESDCDDGDVERFTGPNAVGEITHQSYGNTTLGTQGHIYDVVFPNGVWVFIDEHELANAVLYTVGT